jgi:hypothetical protein
MAQPGPRTITISPPASPTCSEEFETIANGLQPGDTLILRGGVYSQECRRAITVVGTASAPITIRAADGETPILTRPDVPGNAYPQNNIEVVDSQYLILRGLTFRGGSRGVRFMRGNNITFEGNEVSGTANNAISLNDGDTDRFILRRNHIFNTGQLAESIDTTEGEGLYVGCNDQTCIASNHLIEGNYIHDLRATSGGGNDGIEIKPGSYGNIVRDNVIHTTTLGTRYPCIFVYGGGAAATAVNVVEGNALWDCGEAIQVAADATIHNNLILDSDQGLTAAPHTQSPTVRNVIIANNTFYGHDTCAYLRWSGATGVRFDNNAVYCPGATAFNMQGLSGANARANFFEGGGAPADNVAFVAGGSSGLVFANPAARAFWLRPGVALNGAADLARAPATDFNGQPRIAPPDVGAYETNGAASNPGWAVAPGFKPTPNPMLTVRTYLPAVQK